MTRKSSIKNRLTVEDELGTFEQLAVYMIAREFARLDFTLQVLIGVTLIRLSKLEATRLLDRTLTRQEVMLLNREIGFPDDIAPVTARQAWERIVTSSMDNIRSQNDRVLREATGMAISLSERQHIEQSRQFQNKITAEMSKVKKEIIQNHTWSDKHFSQRIWDNSFEMQQRLIDLLSDENVWGKTPAQLREMLGDLNSNSRYNIIRLIRTEAAAMDSLTGQAVALSLGIDKYTLIATLDERTSDTCIILDGRIGSWEGARVGIELPPFHPHCRTIASFLYEEP